MTVGFLLTCAAKDLRRRLTDRSSLAIWLGIPLLIGGLLSLLGGGDSGTVPKARVLLVDEDQSLVGRVLASAGSGQAGEFLDVERVTADEGKVRMDAGDASAMLVLPRGLGEAILSARPATITLVKNPSQRILPEIVQTGVEMLVEATFYAQRLLGGSLRELQQQPRDADDFFPNAAVEALSGQLNERLRRVSTWLFPPVLSLDAAGDRPGTADDTFAFATFMLPAMIFMSLLFISQGMADDVWDEKDAGTLRRAVSAPHDLTLFLGGKLLATALFMAAVAAVAIAVAVAFFGLPPARAPLAFAWCAFTGPCLYCFFQLLQFAGTTKTGASMISTMVLFPAMMLGGSFFPFAAMPGWMAAVGMWLPNGQAVAQLTALLRGAADPGGVALAAVAIGVPAAAAFLLSARLLGGRFVRGA
jgi:ABC-type multidrug transport system permease subunit